MDRKYYLATALRVDAARYDLDGLFRSVDPNETPLYDEYPVTVSININGRETRLPIFNDDGSVNEHDDTMWLLLDNFLECATEYYSQLAEYICDDNRE